jgi:xanthine/CO dehydrogenase XdhC/CoxF family maturation factor
VRGRYRLDRTGDLSAALTVRYSVGGTATEGADYRALDGIKTIKAGKSRAWFGIIPLDDPEVEPDETVTVTLVADAAYEVGAPASGTVTLVSDDVGGGLPVVSIAVSDATATEAGPTSGSFTVSRTGDSSAALTVNYGTGGTANSGGDYAALSGSVTLAAGATSASISVDPVDDTEVEADETVEVSLSADAAYEVGSPSNGTVTIVSDDVGSNLPVVTITLRRDAAEAGRTRGRVRIDRTGPRGRALTVRYSVGGTATSGDDFKALSGEKKIKSGKAQAWFDIVPVNDTVAEGDESVVLTILPDPAYQVGAAGSVTVNIVDNDQNDQQAAR